jgi:uncharacterized membrane protein YbhN (UPF0104 family)
VRAAEAWRWLRLAGGAAVVVVLLLRLGTRPVLDALAALTPATLVAAVAVTAVTTVCCAWRWQLVAGRLGAPVRLPVAVGAYYRSQFLNATLPGGVVGDVHRAVRQGRDAGHLGRGLRSVAWERAIGQAVQVVLVMAALVVLPRAVQVPVLWVGAAVGGALAAVGGLALLGRVRRSSGRRAHWPLHDLRRLLARPRVAVAVLATSAVAALAHAGLFLVAARAAGVAESGWRLLPLALLVLVASAVPTNVAGWGPREGAAAWAFAGAGLTADQGLTVSILYGSMVLVATLPGAFVLLVEGRRRSTPGRRGSTGGRDG